MALLGSSFAFIHVHKTGGTSLRSLLTPYSQEVADKHATASDVRNVIGCDAWDSLYTFGFVRNPFTWCVSTYRYIQRDAGHPDCGVALQMGFSEFIREVAKKLCGETSVLKAGYYTLVQGICGADGTPLVDFVGSFERYTRDVEALMRGLKLGIPDGVPHSNYAEYNRNMLEYYSDGGTIDVVRSSFQGDFEAFGYSSNPECVDE